MGQNRGIEELLAEQIAYYRARASEYDEWWERRGRFDRGAQANARWFAETEELREALERFDLAGSVLELACGTGIWTERLAGHAARLTAVDSSPEVIAINRARVGGRGVDYVTADLFEWEPEELYDACFFGFWLSHVPYELFAEFWAKIARALAPAGRVFFVDSARSALVQGAVRLPAGGGETQRRRLSDGREYTIVKHWFEPAALSERLRDVGWEIEVHATPTFFVYGHGRPRAG